MGDEPARSCAFCGTANDDDAVFCGACGRPLAGPTAHPRNPDLKPGAQQLGSKTVFGMPAASPPASAKPQEIPAVASAPALGGRPGALGDPWSSGSVADSGKTVLGMPSPVGGLGGQAAVGPDPVGPGSEGGLARPRSDAGLTMLGVPTPARPGGSSSAPAGPGPAGPGPGAAADDGRVSSISLTGTGLRPARGAGVAFGVVVVLLVLAAGGLAALLVWDQGGATVTPHVTAVGDVIRVTLVVDPAPTPGGRLRFAGQERPLERGSAVFEVPGTSFRVGENRLAVQVVDSRGRVSAREVRVFLTHRAAADLTGLQASPPYYAVRFQVADGTRLVVAGRPVESQGGVYVLRVLLSEALAGAADSGDVLVHRVPFTVQPPSAEPIAASVETSIPRTRLRLDRPSEGTVVARESVICTGVAEAGAAVTVNGATVDASSGRFEARVPLPVEGQNRIEVVASLPAKAPRTVAVSVRRVASLAPFIEEYAATVDREVDYAAIARDPSGMVGRRVVLRGRIVALEATHGQTLMQLLVREGCATQDPCFLYAAHDGETDARVQTSVVLYGEVTGSRELPTQGGSRLTMPAVHARFVSVDRAGTR